MAKLRKSLKLWDVVALCLGAMFSSGFFLLPGLAFSQTGPSVFLAYIGAGFLILPSMLSQAELCTAMPKSGGVYFFLDRAFGPVIGTIGGLGAYFGLVLKTAFALVGFGAYLQVYTSLPSTAIALCLTVGFVLLNLFGAKESGSLQRVMVSILVLAMVVFLGEGLRTLALTPVDILSQRFSGFFAGGVGKFFYTMAFVFVSYAGLTKVGSVAEEVVDPDRNIPLGMAIALFLAMVIYGFGVFIVVALVPGAELMNDLQPIASAESYAFSWLPGSGALWLVTGAALMAFASTGNAGILASSRYPMAMARDHLVPELFGGLNRFKVPGLAILITGVLMAGIILFVSEEGIAKFASAFQLTLLLLLNVAVIVMRESRITTYDPGYKSPFYPWMQLWGILASLTLLIYMGTAILLIMVALTVLFYFWYRYYARHRVVRHGAIYHWFARLGKRQYNDLETELWEIMKDKGVRDGDPLVEILSDTLVVDLEGERHFSELIDLAAETLSEGVVATTEQMRYGFEIHTHSGFAGVVNGLTMTGLRLVGLKKVQLVVFRCPDGFIFKDEDVHGDSFASQNGRLALFLVSPERQARLHLRLMAAWILHAENGKLVESCLSASTTEGVLNVLSGADLDSED